MKNNLKNIKQKIINEYMILVECKNCKYFSIHKNKTIACNINIITNDEECIILNKYLNLAP